MRNKNTRKQRWSCVLTLLLAATPALRAADPIDSRYTSTARAKAISFQLHDGEGGGGFEGLFPGHGGYQLLHLSGDDRSWINLKWQGKTVDLYAETMAAGPGSFPNKANDVVEWRGVMKGDRFVPYALIYRLDGTNEETQKKKTRLLVIKLDGENSKIIGHAQGANEDADAKKIADTVRPR